MPDLSITCTGNPIPGLPYHASVLAPSACPSQVMNEVEVMQAAGYHPNLVHFHGWYRDPQDGQLCLVMGFCEGGTLARLLKVWGSVNECMGGIKIRPQMPFVQR